MLRGSREDHGWTDEELEMLVSDTSGYDTDEEDSLDDYPRKWSSRRRIEELRELRRLRANLDDFDTEMEDDDLYQEDDFEEPVDEYREEDWN